MTKEPMSVQEALEVAASGAEECFLQEPDPKFTVEQYEQAAAVLRRLSESGFIEAAVAWADHCGPLTADDMVLSAPEFRAVIAAYRKFMEQG